MTSFGISPRPPVDGHAGEHLAPGRSGLVRLLAEQVLDAQDVGEGQVAVLALELLGQGLPADDRRAVRLGDLAQLVRPGGRPEVARQLRADQDERRRSRAARPP